MVYFGGVYRNSEVWINGNYLGRRPSGYSSFYYDLTPHLTYPGANVITVKVDNSAQPGSRWYSGTGIYRDVRLLVRDKLSIPIWGTAVTTPVAEADRAEVSIASTIANDYPSPQTFTFGSSLLDADGRTVARVANQVSLARARLFFCTGRYRRLSEGRIILLPITVVRAADRASLSALELGRQGRRPYPGGMFLQLRDLLYVECSVTDRAGNLVPKADNMLQFRVEGPASIVGVENGDQFNQESFKADHRRAFNGKCLAIIKSSRRAGLVTFSAYSAGLETATTTIAIH